MTKVEEKLKAGRVKRPEGSGFSEEQQKKHAGTRSNSTEKYLAKLILVNIDFHHINYFCTIMFKDKELWKNYF